MSFLLKRIKVDSLEIASRKDKEEMEVAFIITGAVASAISLVVFIVLYFSGLR